MRKPVMPYANNKGAVSLNILSSFVGHLVLMFTKYQIITLKITTSRLVSITDIIAEQPFVH